MCCGTDIFLNHFWIVVSDPREGSRPRSAGTRRLLRCRDLPGLYGSGQSPTSAVGSHLKRTSAGWARPQKWALTQVCSGPRTIAAWRARSRASGLAAQPSGRCRRCASSLALAPLLSHVTGKVPEAGTSFVSQAQHEAGRQAVHEP
jgi:hypothetical protein